MIPFSPTELQYRFYREVVMIIFLAHFKLQLKLTCAIFFLQSFRFFNVLLSVCMIVVCSFIKCTGEVHTFF